MVKVELGGVERIVRFNQMTLEVYLKNVNFEAETTSAVYAVFFAGLTSDCYVKRIEPDFTFADVVDWVDELYKTNSPKIEEVSNAFAATQMYRDWLQNVQDKIRTMLAPTDKKKVKKSK